MWYLRSFTYSMCAVFVYVVAAVSHMLYFRLGRDRVLDTFTGKIVELVVY